MANTWLPRHSTAPVKEGRDRSLLMVKSRSRRRWVVYLLLAAAAVWLVISHSAASSSVSYSTAKDSYSTAKDRLAEFAHPKAPQAAEAAAAAPAAKDEIPLRPTTPDPPKTIKNKDPIASDPIPSLLHGSFDAALDNLFSIFPDELYRSELLRPITATNNKRLRELGLRSQAYQRYFEAWEKLHLVTSSEKGADNYYPLDNLIPYMRARLTTEAFPEALHKYESYRHFLTQLSKLLFPWTTPYYPDHLSLHASIHHGGRGIVVLVGNNHAHFLLASIPTIRTLGCDLPIEIMYLGDGDLRKDFRVELEALPGVTTRDLSMMVDDEGWELAGWAGKPFSILLSSFNEVMLIDADSLFFVNPESFFDDEDYVRTGALFFRDRLIFPESKREWLQEILSEPISTQVMQNRLWTGESGHMQESGIVVVDKWRHFHALLLVSTLNGRDREGNKDADIKGMYDMVYGDKETYWLGWELAGDTSYAFHPGTAAVMGVVQDNDKTGRKSPPGHESDITMCAPQLLHLGRDGRPMWFNGWLYTNKFANTARTIGKFEVFMEEPPEMRQPEAWQLGESNMCCLTNAATRNFTADEMAWLDELIKMAKLTDK